MKFDTDHMQPSIQKTLILRLSSIGDIVLTTPLLRVLKRTYPAMEIDYVVRKEHAELVRYHPAVNRVIDVRVDGGRAELLRHRDSFREAGYDMVLDLHNNFRTKLLRSGLRAPVRVVNKRAFERWLLVATKKNVFRTIVPVAEKYLETVKPYGIEADAVGCEIFFTERERSIAEQKLRSIRSDESKPLVALCPGSRHFTKRWPVEYFSALAVESIERFHADVVILGDASDVAHADVIVRSTKQRAASLCGEIDLLTTAAVMDHATVVITNDSGLMHIATARARPVVALFGSTVQEFGFFPYNAHATVLEVDGLRCRPCSHVGKSHCPKQHFRCMKELMPSTAFDAIAAFITSV